MSVRAGADSLHPPSATVLAPPFLRALRGAGWKRSCALVPLVPSTAVAPPPEPAPRPHPPCGWPSAGSGPREGCGHFCRSLFLPPGAAGFHPRLPEAGPAQLSPGGPRGVPLYRKPAGHRVLSEGPSALGGTWVRCPACSVSGRLFTGSSVLQICGAYLRQRGMDSRRILARLRASTCAAGRGLPEQVKTPQSALGAPCILLFTVPVE